MKKLKRKSVVYTVDPYQGAAGLLTKMSLKGWRLISVDRKDTEATAVYEKIEEK
jgi:hypothetical protein